MGVKFLVLFLSVIFSLHGIDPLPSWNEGKAKKAIIEFVASTTNSSSSDYVDPSERIAVFDQDGTLWVEHPIYPQAMFALDRIKKLAPAHPDWKNQEPFITILENNREKIEKFDENDWAKIIAATHAGMSTDQFAAIAAEWLEQSKHPRFHQPYTNLIYQPMKEVINYFRANGYKTYIVTGGGQEFVRTYSQPVYGIPPEEVIGSSIRTKFEYQPDGKPALIRLPELFFIDNYSDKPVGINLFIGKKSLAAFGNSDGDREMLEWTQKGEGKKLMMLIHHDDPVREYAYGPAGGLPNTKVGTFSDSLMEEAKKRDWIVISIKNDWKRLFP